MANAVFIHKSDSIYDDIPEVRYDFPKIYLSRVEKTVGDWIVYYEPRSALSGKGNLSYFSVAQVDRIVPHPKLVDRFWALLRPGTFLKFDRPVQRQIDDHIFESALRREDGKLLSGGVSNSAVRILKDGELASILEHAFTSDPEALGLDQEAHTVDGFEEATTSFERPIVQRLLNRPLRDATFARQVKRAYRNKCAISGFSLRNGGGRPEVQAAHIRPVKDGGPDTVGNGLALSATLHWMFDRGLISVAEDHTILVSHNKVPKDEADRLFRPDLKLILPDDVRSYPHPEHLRYHREHIFAA